MDEVHGRVGSPQLGYDLRAEWNGQHLRGRVGGRFQGKDLLLTLHGGQVDGRVGGTLGGFDVNGEVTPKSVRVRLGGQVFGEDLRLVMGGDRVTGSLSGRSGSKAVELRRDGSRPEWLRLEGSIGSLPTSLPLGSMPPELAALVAVCAYRALEGDQMTATGRRFL